MMNNKRGQLAFLMTFIVAIALVITALVSFSSFNRNFGTEAVNKSQVIEKVDFGQKYAYEVSKSAVKGAVLSKEPDLKKKFAEIVATKDFRIEEAGNFFAKIMKNEFDLKTEGSGYKLTINGLFTQAIAGNNQIRRDYDLCMEFDSAGNFVKNC